MRKRKSKMALILTIVFVFCLGITCFAASYSFKFAMHTRVIGTTKYSLSAKNTSVTATANTYKYGTNTTHSKKLNYHVNLHKVGSIGKYGAWKSADGKQKTWNIGDVSKGSYNIDLETNQQSGSVYAEVKGSGKINQ